MHQIRKRLTYANVMSSIAVFIVMGGAAYAAVQLPKNSVGTKQIKKNAVIGSKVKNGSLTGADINASTLGNVPSATNANHASAADSASHATSADNATGASSPNTLASGATLRGEWSLLDTAAGASELVGASYDFAFPLSARPSTHYIAPGESTPSGCSGDASNPGAAPGNLCVFADEQINTGAPEICSWEDRDCVTAKASKFGFGLAAFSTAGGQVEDDGSWAVTAP